jgi:hypothetical protein
LTLCCLTLRGLTLANLDRAEHARIFEVFPTFGNLPPVDPQRPRSYWGKVVFA